MFDLLNELAEFVRTLPAGAVLDESLRADLLRRITRVGQGAPMAASGSGYDALRDELTGPGGRYPAPAGPGQPDPPPAPPFGDDQ